MLTAATVSSGLTWKTPKPNCGMVRPLFSMISGTAVTRFLSSVIRSSGAFSARDRPVHPWGGTSITVIPAVTGGRSMAASATAAPSSPITSPSSRSGRSAPSATMASMAG